MPLNAAPIQERITTASGSVSTIWARWFDLLRRELYKSPTYAKADLPTNVEAGSTAFVPNEAGGAVLAFFDGTNWRRVTDRAIVS